MATPQEQMNIDMQSKILDQLKQLNTSAMNTVKAREKQRETRTVGTVQKRFETMSKAADDVTKSIKAAEKEFDKSTLTFGKSIRDVVSDALVPANKTIRKVTQDWKESFEKLVDGQSSDYKEIAKSTRDFIQNNKFATSSVKSTLNVYKDYEVVLKRIKENGYRVSEEDEKTAKKLGSFIDNLSKKHGINLDQKLTAEQQGLMASLQKGTKFSVDQFKKLGDASLEVGKSLQVVGKVTEDYASGLGKSIGGTRSVLIDNFKALFKNLMTVVTVSGRQVLSDLKSQAINAVASSSYLTAGKLGVSQGELSEFIGQNRTALRTIGGGRAQNAISGGQLQALQRQANQFGLTGNDALKYIGASFDTAMKMGLQPTVENTTKQMKTLYRTMQETGMTFEQVNALAADLSQSPAFLQLAQAKGYTGQTEQIEILAKMLKTQGYSTDYLKQLLDLNKQAQYQGIAEAVKSMVGVQLLSTQINRTLGKNVLSNEDIGIQQELTARGQAGLESRYAAGGYDNYTLHGKKLTDQFGTGTQGASRFSAYALQKQLELNKNEQQAYAGASAGNLYGGLVQKTLLGAFGQMAGPAYQQMDESLKAQANLTGMTGTTNPTQAQQNALIGANDTLISNIGQVNSAFVPFGRSLNELIIKMQQWAGGFVKNPLGQAAGAIGGLVGGIWTLRKGFQALGVLKNFLGMGGAAAEGASGGAGGGLLRGALKLGGRGLAALDAGALALPTTAALAIGSTATAGYSTVQALRGKDASNFISNWDAKDKHGIGSWITDTLSNTFGPKANIPTFSMASYNNRHGIINGAHTMTSLQPNKPDIKSELAEKAIVPSGDTMGDLLATMIEQLNKMIDINNKQLSLTTDTHQEYMDYLVKQSNDSVVKAASQAALSIHTTGH